MPDTTAVPVPIAMARSTSDTTPPGPRDTGPGATDPAASAQRRPPGGSPDGPALPRHAFWKGAAVGLFVDLPLLAGVGLLLSQLGLLGSRADFEQLLRLALVFAGLPAVITAGGIGRVAARAAVAEDRLSIRAAINAAAQNHAVAGMGLLLLVMIPTGGLPEEPRDWVWLFAAGGLCGSLCGALIGLLVAAPWPVTGSAAARPGAEISPPPLRAPRSEAAGPETASAAAANPGVAPLPKTVPEETVPETAAAALAGLQPGHAAPGDTTGHPPSRWEVLVNAAGAADAPPHQASPRSAADAPAEGRSAPATAPAPAGDDQSSPAPAQPPTAPPVNVPAAADAATPGGPGDPATLLVGAGAAATGTAPPAARPAPRRGRAARPLRRRRPLRASTRRLIERKLPRRRRRPR